MNETETLLFLLKLKATFFILNTFLTSNKIKARIEGKAAMKGKYLVM
jgi:hypothetical protein